MPFFPYGLTKHSIHQSTIASKQRCGKHGRRLLSHRESSTGARRCSQDGGGRSVRHVPRISNQVAHHVANFLYSFHPSTWFCNFPAHVITLAQHDVLSSAEDVPEVL
ncbi:uncharacterized protein G2W53_001106 [Senna tora]|uniref:Uncharacterized protein n=1 Tax=Senna tora TaxID=362788 RepID=A0A835CK17_9FABA|nr:uncharacterized protein G2W53_001106 [Senna tora]